MSIENLSDQGVLALYQNIREQVVADMHPDSPDRLLFDSAKAQAQRLWDEFERRRLRFAPVDWLNWAPIR